MVNELREARTKVDDAGVATIGQLSALETLNLLLQTRGLVLRDEDGRLVLEDLKEIKKENIPTFVGDLPEDVTADTLVTLIVPLVNATAASVSEQLKEMVAEYGMVVALPQQNSLLLVETAANIRRIQLIVDELDREDVENQVEQIPLTYASATELLRMVPRMRGGEGWLPGGRRCNGRRACSTPVVVR